MRSTSWHLCWTHVRHRFTKIVFLLLMSDLCRIPTCGFLKKPPTIVLPTACPQTKPRSTDNDLPAPPTAILCPNAYGRVKEYLKTMLHGQLLCCETHPEDHMHSIFTEMPTMWIVEHLHHQFEVYWCNEWPFSIPVKNGNPLTWWKSLGEHPHAHVLSVQIMWFIFHSMHTDEYF